MTRDKLKSIFSRFENLNLLALLISLEKDEVVKRSWILKPSSLWQMAANPSETHEDWQSTRFCPLAHGWKSYRSDTESRLAAVGIEKSLCHDFIKWWDCNFVDSIEILSKDNEMLLMSVIKEILNERQADFDAYQGLMEAPCDVSHAEQLALTS